jgi:hypothetical protein
VKEAEALTEAGFRVHVISGRHFPPVDSLDEAIFSTAPWSHTRVDSGRGVTAFRRKLARRIARRLIAAGSSLPLPLVARAHHADTIRLADAAARTRATLYIGHCLAGLPAAALAARAANTRYGFDAEDFHEAETNEALSDPLEVRIRPLLSRHCLPGCVHLTAASPLISQHYADKYGVPAPTTVLNVFPRSHAPRAPLLRPVPSAEHPARCYWFSQTIGPGRGLEATVAILAQMRTPVELHLRGYPAPGYAKRLQALATHCRLRHPIVFLPSADPGEMVRLAADADLGLAVEESTPLNRTLCLTNKIFVYLLAGVPQLMSHTAAQAALAPELGCAAILARLDAPAAVSARIDAFLNDPTAVSAARREAWRLAQTKYCWDVEREKLIASIENAVA